MMGCAAGAGGSEGLRPVACGPPTAGSQLHAQLPGRGVAAAADRRQRRGDWRGSGPHIVEIQPESDVEGGPIRVECVYVPHLCTHRNTNPNPNPNPNSQCTDATIHTWWLCRALACSPTWF